MRFEITYNSPRRGVTKREVGHEHFEKSAAFAPVLRLAVGQYAPDRYRSAGYKRIKRIA